MKARVILIGGFNKTRSLAKSLLKKGYHVTVINENEENCKHLAEIEKLTVFVGDGTKPFVLEDANAYHADIAIALTERDDDNLVICELCKKKFQVKKTVSIVSEANKIQFFHRMGVDSVVCAVNAIANIIEQQAFLNEMATMVPIGESHINIAQVSIAASTPAAGKQLREMRLPKGVIVACILREDKSRVPHGDTVILPGDTLVLIASEKQEVAAIKELTGRTVK